MERVQAEGCVCNRRREKGNTEALQAVIQLERVKGEEYHIGHMHAHIHYHSKLGVIFLCTLKKKFLKEVFCS